MVYEWVALKNMENEKCIVYYMVYERVKMKNIENEKNSHCRTWYMCKLQHGKLETHTVEHGIWVICTKNMENEKRTF
jgi:hypothetical protein